VTVPFIAQVRFNVNSGKFSALGKRSISIPGFGRGLVQSQEFGRLLFPLV